jgi:hypothetical protein
MNEVGKRAELFEWMRFCKEKIDPIDKTWNKRLEDPATDSDNEDKNEEDDVIKIKGMTVEEEEDRTEKSIENILAKVPSRGRGVVKKSAAEAAAIRDAINSHNDDDDDEEDEGGFNFGDSPRTTTWEEPLSSKMDSPDYN